MTKAWLVLASLLGAAPARACPDISGVYRAPGGEGSLVRFEQRGCEQLTRAVGERRGDEADFAFPVVFDLSGSPSCVGGACESFEATANALRWRLSGYAATWFIPAHGRCSLRGADFSRDAAGGLVAEANVFNCRDEYRGVMKLPLEAL